MAAVAVAFIVSGALLQVVFVLADAGGAPARPELSVGALSAVFTGIRTHHGPARP